MTLHHNYSGTRHGKGESDGESGVVKRKAPDAVKAGTSIISTPEQLYNYLKETATIEAEGKCCLPFRRSVFFVKSEDICRDRQNRIVRTVKGTRKLHSIKSVNAGEVATRNLSCFCEACRCDVGRCKNSRYVRPWMVVELHSTTQGILMPYQCFSCIHCTGSCSNANP